LEGNERGVIRAQIEQEVRDYITEKAVYEERIKQAKREDRPKELWPAPPLMPAYLALGFELQRWGVLLVAGGLLDQPAWTWELTDLAMSVYYMVTQANVDTLQQITGAPHGNQPTILSSH